MSLIGRLKLRKTEVNGKDIKNVIYVSGNRKKNNNLKFEDMSGGKKKPKTDKPEIECS